MKLDKTASSEEESVPSPSSENEVRQPDADAEPTVSRRNKRDSLRRQISQALRMTLDVAIRKQKLKVEYMRKEIEMKRRLHQLKMEMLRKELEYKKQMLDLMREEL